MRRPRDRRDSASSVWKTKSAEKAHRCRRGRDCGGRLGCSVPSVRRASGLRAELAAVDEMLAIAEPAALRPDARVHWLVDWIKANLLSGDRLEQPPPDHLHRIGGHAALAGAAAARGDSPTPTAPMTASASSPARPARIAAKRSNAPSTPIRTEEPLRILICTDAAREGINLQTYCSDLIHFDLPWNPSRLEQRNGRIDRKLQPAKQVFCRYFRYEQREADIVLEALVRKTEAHPRTARLGRPGHRGPDHQAARRRRHRPRRRRRRSPARSRRRTTPNGSHAPAPRWTTMNAFATSGLLKEQARSAASALERSRERVGVDPDDLQRVVGAALTRAGLCARSRARRDAVGKCATFQLRSQPIRAFAKDAWLAGCVRRSARSARASAASG